MIVSLVGGRAEARQQILEELNQGSAVVLRLFLAEKDRPSELRADTCRRRLRQLKQALQLNTDKSLLVIDRLLMPEEAALVRQAGGFVWCVGGYSSPTVPYEYDDIYVRGPKARGEYGDWYMFPDEALHECVVRSRQRH